MGVGNWFPAVADSHGWDKPEFYEMIYVDYADGVETAEPEHYRTLEHLFYNHVLRLLPKSYQRVYRRAGHYEWEREWGQAGGIILAENGLLMCCARSLEVSGECALYFLVKRNEDNERVWPLAERRPGRGCRMEYHTDDDSGYGILGHDWTWLLRRARERGVDFPLMRGDLVETKDSTFRGYISHKAKKNHLTYFIRVGDVEGPLESFAAHTLRLITTRDELEVERASAQTCTNATGKRRTREFGG